MFTAEHRAAYSGSHFHELYQITESWFATSFQDVGRFLNPLRAHGIGQTFHQLPQRLVAVHVAGKLKLGQDDLGVAQVGGEPYQGFHVVGANLGPLRQLVDVASRYHVVAAEALGEDTHRFIIPFFWVEQHTVLDRLLGLTSAVLDEVGQSQRRVLHPVRYAGNEAVAESCPLLGAAVERQQLRLGQMHIH